MRAKKLETYFQGKCDELSSTPSATQMDLFELKLKTMPELKAKIDVKLIANQGKSIFKNVVDKSKAIMNEQQSKSSNLNYR